MSTINVTRDTDDLTMTVTTTFDATLERVWQLWEDPRQLERWWGPPTYPATVVDHDLRPDGHVSYYMTGPEGDVHKGWWRIVEVDPPARLVFDDGFADENGEPNPDMPVVRSEVTLERLDESRTRMILRSRFPSTEAMERLLEMGMEEGMMAALGQIEDILAED